MDRPDNSMDLQTEHTDIHDKTIARPEGGKRNSASSKVTTKNCDHKSRALATRPPIIKLGLWNYQILLLVYGQVNGKNTLV